MKNEWIANTISFTEMYYHQNVNRWEETSNAYIFYYDQIEIPIYIAETGEIYLGIHKIEYVKPDSSLTSELSYRTEYESKFVYYYGCSSSYTAIEPLTKSHYYDDGWMINKAIEYMSSGGYVNVYGLALYTS